MQSKPRKTKYLKYQKLFWKKNKKHRPFLLNCQNIKIISRSHFILQANVIEALRKKLTRLIRKSGKLKIHIFPHLPKTKKPLEVRMGRGKGNIDFWGYKSYLGYVLFEIEGFSPLLKNKFLDLIKYKIGPKRIYASIYK